MSKKRKPESPAAIPERFKREMAALLGEEEAALLMESLETAPSVSLRVNRRKVADPEAFIQRFADHSPSPVAWCESGFYLDSRPDFIHDPLLHAGCYYVQEAASMVYETIVGRLIKDYNLTAGGRQLRVLDLCAAPGGKSTAILNVLEGDYVLVANEFDRKRAGILKENLEKWGDPNVVITNSNTERFRRLDACFDLVAVDAPCSGEGMMRREPVARSQWSEALIEQCSSLQRDILGNAMEALRPGGFLIYSTCTFNRAENEDNCKWLTASHGLLPVGTPRHFYPHRDRCEGLFVAVFQKPEDESQPGVSYRNAGKLTDLLRKAGITVIADGVERTVKKGDMELPSSKRVLAHDYDASEFPAVNLSREDAVAYLRRNALRLPGGTPHGYVAVCYEGHPLGLVKNIGPRANNLYPPEWRVLT